MTRRVCVHPGELRLRMTSLWSWRSRVVDQLARMALFASELRPTR